MWTASKEIPTLLNFSTKELKCLRKLLFRTFYNFFSVYIKVDDKVCLKKYEVYKVVS
jgi:hypothetical protein